MSGAIPNNGNSKNARFAFINATASGDTTLATLPAGSGARSRIRVLAVVLTTTAENTVKFKGGSADITAAFPFVALGGMVLPFNEHGWFECAANTVLKFNQSVATPCAVQIVYTVVD